jgi:hypothetical protein
MRKDTAHKTVFPNSGSKVRAMLNAPPERMQVIFTYPAASKLHHYGVLSSLTGSSVEMAFCDVDGARFPFFALSSEFLLS